MIRFASPALMVAVVFAGSFVGRAQLSSGGCRGASARSLDRRSCRRFRASDWTYDRAAHLIERAGFGETPDEIARLAAMTPKDAVDRLVDYESIDNSSLKPFDESGIWDPGMDPFPPSRAEAVRHRARARRRRSA